MYIMLIGYGNPIEQGQVNTAGAPPLEKSFKNRSKEHFRSVALMGLPYQNALSCIPILNIISGTMKIYQGIFSDGSGYARFSGCKKWQFKILSCTMGLLEITLVGGWIAHGIASIYFKWSLPDRSTPFLIIG